MINSLKLICLKDVVGIFLVISNPIIYVLRRWHVDHLLLRHNPPKLNGKVNPDEEAEF